MSKEKRGTYAATLMKQINPGASRTQRAKDFIARITIDFEVVKKRFADTVTDDAGKEAIMGSFGQLTSEGLLFELGNHLDRTNKLEPDEMRAFIDTHINGDAIPDATLRARYIAALMDTYKHMAEVEEKGWRI